MALNSLHGAEVPLRNCSLTKLNNQCYLSTLQSRDMVNTDDYDNYFMLS